jgi:acetyltransferase-like isoleucine patch superfamily enzyme
MIGFITYFESVRRNRSSRIKGFFLKLYLLSHGCKVGKGLKCATWPYFKGFPNRNIEIGDHVDLGKGNTIELNKEGRLFFGDHVLLHQNILISCNKEIVFEKWCAVAENASIRDGNHQFAADKYYRLQDTLSEKIIVGEGSGIAAGTVVLPGSVIAKGAFIGANSLVTRHDKIEVNGIYGGNPLKLIKFRK